ncbi:phenylalanyl-tRNA synthetase, beta subunit [Thermocrinis albus DSM 14484]|uniref:Phenylalanine--tRNA ligase beta subunit n=1 Tax=Thermocrinis albus (strain DSM 14484 / JCM 11386 / HI 11/12) TaxID=638303 RepID=D3SNW8_THEAH|nr:phenylalanine--tRNA ligase subunit beta [Thermocrinis albus]ADC88855.1 phenylalanyl-tRNA synthetase, beta subunit [Thermocrinis albus DSM 14484]
MIVPFSLLSQLVDTEGLKPEEIAHRLTLCSAETSLLVWERDIEGVLVGKVLSCEPHPSDIGLLLVKVYTGRETLQVITRDGGVKEGHLVLLAPAGSFVMGKRVEKRTIGGVVSEGVLLSYQDLKLEDSEQGVIKWMDDTPLGTSGRDLLSFGEILLEIDVTPNRGDLLSVRGVAREVAALFGRPMLKEDTPTFEETGSLDIEVHDGDCKRYRGVYIEKVKVGPSPLWLKKVLWQCGMKSINNVVDVTNYITIRDGQPLHAFDMDQVKGGIRVRSAEEGERLITLAHQEITLTKEDLVIADQERPLALAGVIGGLDSGVTHSTNKILLESAFFDPVRVRRSAKRHKIQTESSYRFERGVDIEGVAFYQNSAVDLILRLAGGQLVAVKDIYPTPYTPKTIMVTIGKMERYTGKRWDLRELQKRLEPLGFQTNLLRCGLEVKVPSWRSFDIKEDVDVLEEILRLEGYDQLPSHPLYLPARVSFPSSEVERWADFLAHVGFREVITFSFEDDQLYHLLNLERPTLSLVNPLAKSQSYMRSSLVPSLLRTCLYNQRNYNQQVAIFELGKVYHKDGEELRLGLLSTNLHSVEEFKNIVYRLLEGYHLETEFSAIPFLHPHLQVLLKVEDEVIGFMGRLHPALEEKLEIKGKVLLAELRPPSSGKKREELGTVSPFPPVVRDISLVMDKEVSVAKLISSIRRMEGVEDVSVFDVYIDPVIIGEGKKSVSFRLILRSNERSMSDEEANALVDRVVRLLEETYGVRLR